MHLQGCSCSIRAALQMSASIHGKLVRRLLSEHGVLSLAVSYTIDTHGAFSLLALLLTPCGECESLSHFHTDLLTSLVRPAVSLNAEGTADHHLQAYSTTYISIDACPGAAINQAQF